MACGAENLSEGLSGKDLILATIIAYEIEMRLCQVAQPGVRKYDKALIPIMDNVTVVANQEFEAVFPSSSRVA